MGDYGNIAANGQRVVLFVCTGGVYRSGWAACFFNHYRKSELYVAKSAGLEASTVQKKDVTAAIELMAEKGIGMSGHVPAQLTGGLLKKAWKVYALSIDAAVALKFGSFQRYGPKTESLFVDDPVTMEITVQRKIRDDLEAKVLGILKELGQ